jgi:hypothetical protein
MYDPSPNRSGYWSFVIVTTLILEFLFYSLFSNYITVFERVVADTLLFGAVLLIANQLWPRHMETDRDPNGAVR